MMVSSSRPNREAHSCRPRPAFARPGDESVVLPLKKGLNTVLLKIDQMGGGWGFILRAEP